MREQDVVLQIDLGNSGLKWRLVSGDRIRSRGALDVPADGLCELPELDHQPVAVLVASVAGDERDLQLAAQIRRRWSVEPWFARSEAKTLGLRSSYAQPENMGVDRWLAMLAAWYPSQGRVCVVDAGSALTIDLVSSDGQHEGGYIMPGAALMRRALLRDTQRVRFDESPVGMLGPGRSTAEGVSHGAVLAQCGAVRLAVSLAVSKGPLPLRVVVSGGGGEVIAAILDVETELRRDLVFEGLELAAAAAAELPGR